MATIISAPSDWIEDVSLLHFPPRLDRKLQELME